MQHQSNDEFTHNYFCYDAFALIPRPKSLIPRISRGRGYPRYTADRLALLTGLSFIISLCLVHGKECYLAETNQQFVVHAVRGTR